jgi:tetratricopeptide (TPR) repeat protein
MFDNDFSGSKAPSKPSGRRTVSIILGLLLVNVAYFAIRPLVHDADPCQSRNAYDRGIALDLYGDRAAAIAAYSEALKSNPQHVEALKNRGYDYAALGKFELAAADLSQALTLQPHDWYVLTRRADAYLKLGQFDRALADLTQAVQLAPDVWLTWQGRGEAYMAHGDLDAAIADYTHSLAAGEHNHVDTAYLPRGIAYLRAGKFDLAKVDFATYAAAHFNDAAAVKGRDCAAQGSNTGDCAIPYPTPSNPMIDQLLDAGARSLSGCKQS